MSVRPFAGSRQTAYARSLLRSKCARKARRGAGAGARCRTPTRVYRPNRARFGPRPSGGTRDRRSGSSSPGPAKASSRAPPASSRVSVIFSTAEGKNDESDRGLARATRRRRARLRRRRRYRVATRRRTPKLFAPARRARVRPSNRARGASSRRASSTGEFENAPCGADSHPERPRSTPETRRASPEEHPPPLATSHERSRARSTRHLARPRTRSTLARAHHPRGGRRRGHASPRVTTR